ncbi:E3 ubiquitin-protein ligase RNF186-like [Mugil cephalus]|uniref:E3 ubiquitin-protein ligase RNF186-like n=1 Tax=Mugil cephalus TaxID=48193 RepID=UPI001FB6F55A|nr:E3 ubiquitin-protein ligase RNF186-like [Mugil cephalus]
MRLFCEPDGAKSATGTESHRGNAHRELVVSSRDALLCGEILIGAPQIDLFLHSVIRPNMAEAVSGGGVPDATDSLPGDEYECKICYNYFDLDRRRPKLLSCSHTFCQECLETLHLREGGGWRIGCPVCRHRTPVPEYRVRNLPDNAPLTEALPVKVQRVNGSEERTGASVSSSQETNDSCDTCAHVALSLCVCAIVSFLSTVVLLFLGLIFVHHRMAPPVVLCLLTASVLALFSIILTWLTCLLKYRTEPEASNLSSLTSNSL